MAGSRQRSSSVPSNSAHCNVSVRPTRSAENVASVYYSQSSLEGQYSPVNSPVKATASLRCCEVRWCYRPKKDSGKWIPFKGADSLKLEIQWRRVNGVLVDEYSLRELSQAKKKTALSSTVAVLDGLYGVSGDFRTIHTIYWKGDEDLDVRRGTWFEATTLQPVDCDVTEAIEAHHVSFFRARSTTSVTDRLTPEDVDRNDGFVTTLKIPPHFEVKWKSANVVTLHNTARLRYLPSTRKGTPLRRGYHIKCDWEDGEFLVKDLVFVIHGIGQKRCSTIPQHTASLRNNVNTIFEKNCVGERMRTMILPVEWRASLTLDQGLTDATSLPRIWNLREFLNDTFMDIMYYQSPCYRTELLAGLIKSLNRAYVTFKENCPDFNGAVSLLAHSLGSVMCYDVLAGYSPMAVYDRLTCSAIVEKLRASKNNDESLLTFSVAREKFFKKFGNMEESLHLPSEALMFEVKYLFCIGSPLAVFLIMRGADAAVPKSLKVKRIYNIFHPYDPVAYRLEPLVHRQYQLIRPVKVRSASDERVMLSYDILHPQMYDAFKKKQKRKRKASKNRAAAEDDGTLTESSIGSSTTSTTERNRAVPDCTSPAQLVEKIPVDRRLKYRLDYQIQPQMTELSYVSMFSSHGSYWHNVDVAAFIVNQLYQKHRKSSSRREG